MYKLYYSNYCSGKIKVKKLKRIETVRKYIAKYSYVQLFQFDEHSNVSFSSVFYINHVKYCLYKEEV